MSPELKNSSYPGQVERDYEARRFLGRFRALRSEGTGWDGGEGTPICHIDSSRSLASSQKKGAPMWLLPKPMVPCWGRFTTRDWDVHWGYGLLNHGHLEKPHIPSHRNVKGCIATYVQLGFPGGARK